MKNTKKCTQTKLIRVFLLEVIKDVMSNAVVLTHSQFLVLALTCSFAVHALLNTFHTRIVLS